MTYQNLVQNVNNGSYDSNADLFWTDCSKVQCGGITVTSLQGLAGVVLERVLQKKESNVIDISMSSKNKAYANR